MKQGNNKNRNRGHNRGNNNRGNRPNIPSKNQVFESSGPSGKIRGNLMQLIEKYLGAGKDAMSQDDIVLAENCFQYADHYTRLYNLANAYDISRREEQQRMQQQRNNGAYENSDTVSEVVVESEEDCSCDTVAIENEPEKEIEEKEKETTTNQVADIPFLNTEIELPEEKQAASKEQKRKRTLRNKKKNETVEEAVSDVQA